MTAESPRKGIARVLHWIHVLENWTLVLLLSGMILVALFQIIARNLFDGGFALVEPFLRVGVLWVGMLGALVASRDNHHISLDILTRFLPRTVLPWVRLFTYSFTAAVCAIIAWQSARFVLVEIESESVLFGVVPAWPFEIVLPIGFGLIGLRYAIHSVTDFNKPHPEPDQELA